jgi:predicted dehydrogenase
MMQIALAGVGGYGTRHLRRFEQLEGEGRLRVSALADPSVPALEKAKSIFPGARAYASYDDLLERETVDAALLTVPIPLHEEMALKTLERGIHLLLEKPAVPLVSQLDRLIQADVRGLTAVAFQRVSSPAMKIVRGLLHEGRLGKPRSISAYGVWPRDDRYYQRASWAGTLEWHSQPVLDGPATNAFAHMVNDIFFLGRDSPLEPILPAEVSGELYRARPIPSHDTACLRGRLPNGIEFFAGFSHSSASAARVRLRVTGSKGSVWLEEDGSLHSPDLSLPECEKSDGCLEMIRAFLDFAAGRRSRPDVTLRDVTGYTLATNMMFQSAGSIRPVDSQVLEDEKGMRQYVVPEVGAYLARASEQLCSLKEAGAPWGHPGKLLKKSEFSEATMLANLGMGEATASVLGVRELAPAFDPTPSSPLIEVMSFLQSGSKLPHS